MPSPLPAVRAATVSAPLHRRRLGCAKPPAAPPPTPPAPVVVTAAVKKTVPVQVRAIGSVKVDRHRRRPAAGRRGADRVHFKEGDFVKKGQKLFTIDPRPYEAAVKQAEANLAKNKAVLRGAELDLQRVEQAGSRRRRRATELDAAATAVASAKAAVAADEAALNSAKLQAGFTTITSPHRRPDRRAARHRAATSSSAERPEPAGRHQPDQPDLRRVLPARAAAARRSPPPGRTGPLKVEADLRGGELAVAGELAFIDNAVDPTTGTVQLKAEFPNEDQHALAGAVRGRGADPRRAAGQRGRPDGGGAVRAEGAVRVRRHGRTRRPSCGR